MKRFMAFVCATYYPSGGIYDFVGSYDTEDEAWKAYNKLNDELHVVDIVNDVYKASRDDEWRPIKLDA